ncbi:hypothetical protein BD626DRAFT_534815 [Schizophyllum amplum]|uniref:Uncharacterized protein n=1 Tax=Schizophyllum amplum TaxID=97359 RepID=A0A550CPD6_9AGAR|nr:hypothetical protein BD626DRAFT_534815 [Auriculariopsis ampla]
MTEKPAHAKLAMYRGDTSGCDCGGLSRAPIVRVVSVVIEGERRGTPPAFQPPHRSMRIARRTIRLPQPTLPASPAPLPRRPLQLQIGETRLKWKGPQHSQPATYPPYSSLGLYLTRHFSTHLGEPAPLLRYKQNTRSVQRLAAAGDDGGTGEMRRRVAVAKATACGTRDGGGSDSRRRRMVTAGAGGRGKDEERLMELLEAEASDKEPDDGALPDSGDEYDLACADL